MRNSFLDPVPELHLAATLLDACADLTLWGKRTLAASLLAAADRPEILSYTRRICSRLSLEVHRQTRLPKTLPVSERAPGRMPSAETQRSIFRRDGWRCRYCGIRVISRGARKFLIVTYPTEAKWGAKEFERHAALYSTAASLDHIVPHSRGGQNEISNFVTACYCCQFGRGQYLLSEVEFSNPLDRAPVQSDWDGLSRLERGASARRGTRTKSFLTEEP